MQVFLADWKKYRTFAVQKFRKKLIMAHNGNYFNGYYFYFYFGKQK